MFGVFNPSNFSGMNILVISSRNSDKDAFISNVKDNDSVVLDSVDIMSHKTCFDAIKDAGWRQIIVSLKDCNTENRHVLKYDYIVIFNDRRLEWREDVYYAYSLVNTCVDFNDFSKILDSLDEGECAVISVDEGTMRRMRLMHN